MAAKRMTYSAPEPALVKESEYRMAVADDVGWCISCEEFAGEGIEPDAERYRCPICDKRTLLGAEQALVRGLIEFKEET